MDAKNEEHGPITAPTYKIHTLMAILEFVCTIRGVRFAERQVVAVGSGPFLPFWTPLVSINCLFYCNRLVKWVFCLLGEYQLQVLINWVVVFHISLYVTIYLERESLWFKRFTCVLIGLMFEYDTVYIFENSMYFCLNVIMISRTISLISKGKCRIKTLKVTTTTYNYAGNG